jgi:hypothetical protein
MEELLKDLGLWAGEGYRSLSMEGLLDELDVWT